MTAFQRGLSQSNSLAEFLGLLEAGARRQQQGEFDQARVALDQEQIGLQRDEQARMMEEQRTEQARIAALQEAIGQKFRQEGQEPPDPRLPIEYQLKELQALPDKQAMGEMNALLEDITNNPDDKVLSPQLVKRAYAIAAKRGWPKHVVDGLLGQPAAPVVPFDQNAAVATLKSLAGSPLERATFRTEARGQYAQDLMLRYPSLTKSGAESMAKSWIDSVDPIARELTPAQKIALKHDRIEPLRQAVLNIKGQIDDATEAAKATFTSKEELDSLLAPLKEDLAEASKAYIEALRTPLDGSAPVESAQPAMTESQIEDAATEFITRNPNATDAEIAAYVESLKAK